MSQAREAALSLSLKPGSDFNVGDKEARPAGFSFWLVSSVLLGILFVGCAVFYVWLYVQQVQNGYLLAKIYSENELQTSVQRKLKLEWSRFRDPNRLEELGRNKFGLAPPRPDQKVLMR
jgi:cell division protein FtsL